MFRDPLVLDVLFLLHIGKGLIYAVTLSVVVPQAIGIFLRNRISDHCNVSDPLTGEEDATMHQIIWASSPMKMNIHTYNPES